jgi:DNA-binding IscR family transcriptional regulator
MVVAPVVREASRAFLASLDAVTLEELCQSAERASVRTIGAPDFTI